MGHVLPGWDGSNAMNVSLALAVRPTSYAETSRRSEPDKPLLPDVRLPSILQPAGRRDFLSTLNFAWSLSVDRYSPHVIAGTFFGHVHECVRSSHLLAFGPRQPLVLLTLKRGCSSPGTTSQFTIETTGPSRTKTLPSTSRTSAVLSLALSLSCSLASALSLALLLSTSWMGPSIVPLSKFALFRLPEAV